MRPAPLVAATVALVVLPATVALAHPSFDPNAVPIGEPVEATLVVPHGCSTGDAVMPEEGEAVPTTRFDLQLLDGVSIEPGEVGGWVAENDGEAIVWTADGGATADPIEFPVTLTVTEGQAGDQLEIAAFQECEDGSSYRWTAGSEGTPPVRLDLTEGEATASEAAPTTQPTTLSPTEPSSPESPATAADEPDTEAVAEDDGNGGTIAAVVAAVVVLLAVGGTLVARRRRTP